MRGIVWNVTTDGELQASFEARPFSRQCGLGRAK